MSLTRLPTSLRIAIANGPKCQRTFHTSSPAKASVLFALGALSNSRETAHFNKISGLPRYEHSPPLKLVKTSEVDAYPCPNPPPPAPPSDAWAAARPASTRQVWDEKALKIGRVFLSEQARQSRRLRHAMARIKRDQMKQDALLKRERMLWEQERTKLEKDMRSAVVLIFASIATATVLAAWRFWPDRKADPTDMGRKIAARAATAMPFPAAVASYSVATKESAPPPPTVWVVKDGTSQTTTEISKKSKRGWMEGLFWKQSTT